jgi:hypothetical protein
LFLQLILNPVAAWAGTPFVSNDPEPLKYREWELSLGWHHENPREGSSSTSAQVEANFGWTTETMLHVLVVPIGHADERLNRGYSAGDLELGLKYRLLAQRETLPEIAVFPLLWLPGSGESSQRGLRAFLPVWLKKTSGPWTTFGGGGLWFHDPFDRSEDSWQAGWVLQREISERLSLGGEILTLSSSGPGVSGRIAVNAGGIYHFKETSRLLFSVGKDIRGPSDFFISVSYLVPMMLE